MQTAILKNAFFRGGGTGDEWAGWHGKFLDGMENFWKALLYPIQASENWHLAHNVLNTASWISQDNRIMPKGKGSYSEEIKEKNSKAELNSSIGKSSKHNHIQTFPREYIVKCHW